MTFESNASPPPINMGYGYLILCGGLPILVKVSFHYEKYFTVYTFKCMLFDVTVKIFIEL